MNLSEPFVSEQKLRDSFDSEEHDVIGFSNEHGEGHSDDGIKDPHYFECIDTPNEAQWFFLAMADLAWLFVYTIIIVFLLYNLKKMVIDRE